jgi:hypothetical protein
MQFIVRGDEDDKLPNHKGIPFLDSFLLPIYTHPPI